MAKTIPLTQGKVAIVDDCDYAELSKYKWCFHKRYAIRNVKANGKCKQVYMHRVIAGTPDGMETDHVNGDSLDNRRCNLRWATTAQNQANRRIDGDNRSGYKGVYFHARSGKWMARLSDRYLGIHETPQGAAVAYNRAAQSVYGEYARINPI